MVHHVKQNHRSQAQSTGRISVMSWLLFQISSQLLEVWAVAIAKTIRPVANANSKGYNKGKPRFSGQVHMAEPLTALSANGCRQ